MHHTFDYTPTPNTEPLDWNGASDEEIRHALSDTLQTLILCFDREKFQVFGKVFWHMDTVAQAQSAKLLVELDEQTHCGRLALRCGEYSVSAENEPAQKALLLALQDMDTVRFYTKGCDIIIEASLDLTPTSICQ